MGLFRGMLTLAAIFELLCIGSVSAQAAERVFEINNGHRVRIEVPKGWTASQGLLNIPLTIFSPIVGGRRASVSVYDGATNELQLDPKEMAAHQDQYQAGRQEWLTKNFGKDGEVLKWIPYQGELHTPRGEVHTIGFQYRGIDLRAEDRSMYLICPKSRAMIYLKSFLSLSHEKELRDSLSKILTSFQCEGE